MSEFCRAFGKLPGRGQWRGGAGSGGGLRTCAELNADCQIFSCDIIRFNVENLFPKQLLMIFKRLFSFLKIGPSVTAPSHFYVRLNIIKHSSSLELIFQ